MAALSPDIILRELKQLKGWELSGNVIKKTYTLKDFVHAMSFLQSVALIAERMNHHPDIDIRWNCVTLVLTTHSEGGLTDKDFNLAQQIERL